MLTTSVREILVYFSREKIFFFEIFVDEINNAHNNSLLLVCFRIQKLVIISRPSDVRLGRKDFKCYIPLIIVALFSQTNDIV